MMSHEASQVRQWLVLKLWILISLHITTWEETPKLDHLLWRRRFHILEVFNNGGGPWDTNLELMVARRPRGLPRSWKEGGQ